ncbi:MAG TPA: hypothetical protein VFG07_02900 [Thermoplasmata archaeon]|nr:hypothetical protein [Thermoplasmata archaeon]
MASRAVLDWLREPGQPAMRYLALRDLDGRKASDGELRDLERQIPRTGWAAQILAERKPPGWWVDGESLYRPKYLATNWQLLVLSDLGLTNRVPAISRSAELWMERFKSGSGALGASTGKTPHHCVAGNQARALLRFGYVDHPAVRRTLEWLVESAHPKGGWACWGSGRTLDCWEGLSAFAAFPRTKWTRAMAACVEKGAEFYLERELWRQGDRYAPWFRFHYPVHYYYDLLVGLDVLTALGYSDDRRLRLALNHLRKKRRPDGRWNLDGVHPDVEGGLRSWIKAHPSQAPTPSALEVPGQPSKMITFLAERVLQRVDQAS